RKTVVRIEFQADDAAVRRVDDGRIAGGDSAAILLGDQAEHRQHARTNTVKNLDRHVRPYLRAETTRPDAPERSRSTVVPFRLLTANWALSSTDCAFHVKPARSDVRRRPLSAPPFAVGSRRSAEREAVLFSQQARARCLLSGVFVVVFQAVRRDHR